MSTVPVLAVSGVLGLLLTYRLIDVWSAAQLLLLTVLCGLVLLLAVQIRRTSVQMRQLRRGFDRQLREVAEIAGENRAELFGRADDLADRLDAVAESVSELRTDTVGRVSDVQVMGSASVPARAAS
ncbi:hypothetical protein ACWFMI_22295 [Nocardiopsis terrae]